MTRRGALLAFGLLAAVPLGQGTARAQLWPLQSGPGGDLIGQATADFDRMWRNAPVSRPEPGGLPGREAGAMPAWTPPPLPQPRPVRRTAAPRREPSMAAAPPLTTPPALRQPELEAAERRLAERERTLRELQRDLAEERKLMEGWRGEQRSSR